MATIGPTLEKAGDIRAAIEAGAGWFRLPCGYRQRPHLANARAVRTASSDEDIRVQLLLDLPSSRPRTGAMPELHLKEGDQVLFWDPDTGACPDQNGTFAVPLPGLSDLVGQLGPRQRMWFCDGRLNFIVDELRGTRVVARLVQGTVPLKSSNSLFLPDHSSPFRPITAQDEVLLKEFAAEKLVPDWIALSLIASATDIRESRQKLKAVLGAEVSIMAKFETVAAVDMAEEIICEADGIMVARGDLGLAVGYVRLPEIQEQLVAAAHLAGKIAVVATQVLETFADTGLPQRAELSDLSLLARQRADVVMLGKETVFSSRPIESIRFAREVLTYEARRFQPKRRRSPVAGLRAS